MLVIGDIKLDGFAGIAVCPKLLALSADIVSDDGVCGLKDMRRAAVVLLKADDTAVLVLVLKREDILYRCTTEFIDTLVIIADNADIAPAACKL